MKILKIEILADSALEISIALIKQETRNKEEYPYKRQQNTQAIRYRDISQST
jgi:hypothetical protein